MSFQPFTAAHRSYVKSLYRRLLYNELDWVIDRRLWRAKALAIRAEFDSNRNVHDPRALSQLFEKAESSLAEHKHPDPYRPPTAPDGSKWERNAPPPVGPIFDHEAFNEGHSEDAVLGPISWSELVESYEVVHGRHPDWGTVGARELIIAYGKQRGLNIDVDKYLAAAETGLQAQRGTH